MDSRCINKHALSFKGNAGLMLRKQLFAFRVSRFGCSGSPGASILSQWPARPLTILTK